ncbi:MAG: hypothetical protein RIC30_11785 [Marinoscillum sp.]|uniref:hypothetical protein n=1 Tax=Marinoscillum sp. TaxID=2024838 RepID=UPI0032FB97D8
MTNKTLRLFALVGTFAIAALTISCGDDDEQGCTHCSDDAPYGTLDGGCYSTLSDCESNESGNCVICQ